MKTQEQIIKEYKKILTINAYISVIIPMFMIIGLIVSAVTNNYRLFMPFGFIGFVVVYGFRIFIDKCPNCGYHFNRYELCLKQCPRCKTKLL